METVAILSFDRKQGERLFSSLQAYRHFALTRLAPTQERNTRLRLVQQFQGRLLAWEQQWASPLALFVFPEERAPLQMIVKSLLSWYATQPASPARAESMTDLGTLYLQLKHRGSARTRNDTARGKPSRRPTIGV